jgi:uncharacterized protein (DUF924 family)
MSLTAQDEIRSVLDFWFSPEVALQWFASTPALDAEIRQRFEPLWRRAAAGECDAWADTESGALALIIVLDQFPLNMYRGAAAAYSSEQHAVRITLGALERGFHLSAGEQQKLFLFLPLMHSENREHQDASVALFAAAGMETRWAEHHRAIVQRFGRFPHRNASLGRDSSAEELAWLASEHAFKG